MTLDETSDSELADRLRSLVKAKPHSDAVPILVEAAKRLEERDSDG